MSKRLLAVLCAGFALTANPAGACQCADQVMRTTAAADAARPEKPLTFAEIQANRLANALVAVRGKVISVQAGADIYFPKGTEMGENTAVSTITSYRAVVANFAVSEALKGKTAKTIQIYTGFGTGD